MLTSFVGGVLPILVAVLGPVLASFIGAQVMRGSEITKANGKRSACDHCGYTLAPFDLIPVFSFLLNRGKCRKCGKAIDVRIWMIEILGLGLFSILGLGIYNLSLSYPNNVADILVYAVFGFVVSVLLLALSIHDIFTFSIPLRFTQISAGIVILANILVIVTRLLDPLALPHVHLGYVHNLLAGLGYAFFFQVIIWLTKQKGMGSGDVFIGLIIGLALGWPATVTAFYAMVFSASLVGIIYAGWKRSYKGTIVPLVPFLSFGFVVAYVWGYNIFSFLFFRT